MGVKTYRRFALAAAAALAACIVAAPGAPRAEDWAGLSKKLRDRCERFNKDFQDLKAKAGMTVVTPEGSMQMNVTTFKKGQKIRAEVEVQSLPGGVEMPALMSTPTIIIGDPDTLWMLHPMVGKIQVPSGEIGQYTQQWYCDTAIPGDAEVVGSESVSGRDCHVVSVKDSTLKFAKMWFDKETTDLLKVEGEAGPGERYTIVSTDFRKLGDDRMPYKTEMYKGAELVSTIIVESVEVNKGLPGDLFDVGKAEASMSRPSDMRKKLQQEQTTPQEEGKDKPK
jgi:outer membrane lipoprotein-sorting protein